MSRLLAAGATLALLTACQPVMPPMGAGPQSMGATGYRAGQPVLSGQVMMPGWTVQATSADILNRALVTLVDAGGITRAAGATDAAGLFTLLPVENGFTPADGEFYTLNASRRLASGAVLSLKSTVKSVGTGWTSITGTTIAVNLTTTAIAGIDADDAAVTPEMTMGKVSGAGYSTVAAIGTWSPERIAGRVTALTAQLAADRDPGGSPAVTYTGDYTIAPGQILANVTGFTAITGNLIINATGLTAIDLPNLTTITGNITVTGNNALATLNLPSLRTVGGDLTIDGNTVLNTLGLGSLATCTGTLTVTNNPALPNIQATTVLSGLTTPPASSTISGNLP